MAEVVEWVAVAARPEKLLGLLGDYSQRHRLLPEGWRFLRSLSDTTSGPGAQIEIEARIGPVATTHVVQLLSQGDDFIDEGPPGGENYLTQWTVQARGEDDYQHGGYPQAPTEDGGYPQAPTEDGGYPQAPTEDGGYPQAPTEDGGYPQAPTEDGGYPQAPTEDGGYPQAPTEDGGYPQAPTEDGGYPQAPTEDGGYPQAPTEDGGYPQAPTEDGGYPQAPTEDGGYPQAPTEDGEYPQAPTEDGGYSQARTKGPLESFPDVEEYAASVREVWRPMSIVQVEMQLSYGGPIGEFFARRRLRRALREMLQRLKAIAEAR